MKIFSRVILVNRSKLFCEILSESLERRNVKVVSYATNGYQAIEQIELIRPDLLIVQNSLPQKSGYEVLRYAKENHPETKCLFMALSSEEAAAVHQEFDLEGHVDRNASMSELFFAIHEIASDRKYVSNEIKEAIYTGKMEDKGLSGAGEGSLLETLTQREQEILQALSESFTTPQIAEKFLISPATVNNHRANIMSKLNLRGRNQLLKLAISLKPYYRVAI